MNNEKIYTAAEFESYHAGTMPVHDMHALEKAALEDPFLSDALDGYVHTPTATNDIEKLQKKLKLEKGIQAPVKSITNKVWWRVAASIVSLLGIGYLFYTVNKKENISTLAKNEQVKEIKIDSEKDKETKVDSVPMLDVTLNENGKLKAETVTQKGLKMKIDTIKNNIPSTFNTTTVTQFNTTDAIAPAAPVYKKEELGNFEKNKEVPLVVSKTANNIDEKIFLNSNQNQDKSNNYYNYSGIVQNRAGGPMQYATIRSKNIVTRTDQNGRFNFKSLDTNINASIAAVGYTKQDIKLNTNTNSIFTLDENDKNLQEVVVTGFNTKKRKSVAASVNTISNKNVKGALAGKVAGVKVNSQVDTFADSIVVKQLNIDIEKETKNFNNYVTKNIKPELDDKANEIKGKVILSFTVNKKGQPRKIKIVQSLNIDCDEQAIQLLENGPTWNFKKGDRRNVVIDF